jgi:hypothetical protein
MATVGLATAKVLAHPEETANRRVYISLFECFMNDILSGYKAATDQAGWNISNVKSDEMIVTATKSLRNGENPMHSIGRLGLASVVKPGLSQTSRQRVS